MKREALRQQMLLRALAEQPGAGLVLRGWTRSRGDGFSIGLNTYRANAAALAERALAAAYPTIAQLVGESFGAIARGLWRREPPERGDVGMWGGGLADFIASQETLAEEAYLPDVARLEWAVHEASRSRDLDGKALQLEALHTHDAAQLHLRLAPGSALIDSAWPIVSIWQAHQRDASDSERFDGVRAAFAAGSADIGERAFVVRDGWAVQVHAFDAGDASFTTNLLAGASLADALDAATDTFAFDRWLVRALQSRWLEAVQLRQ